MKKITVDVCVVGGGPAGSAAANRLARLGYRVCIVERMEARVPAVESLTPAIVPALQVLGVQREIEQNGFLRCERTRSQWQASETVREMRSLVVERRRFDEILLRAAMRAGARSLIPARARGPIRVGSRWIVPVDARGDALTIDAAFLVDASGRSGNHGRLGAPTVALCGRWQGFGVPLERELRLEAGKRAWYWGAPMPDASYLAIAFVDMRDCAGFHSRTRETFYRSLVAASELLGFCLRGELVGGVAVRDATAALDDDPATTMSIKVGARCVALDPLSSQGVQAAVRSALQASAVVHTVLAGGDAAAAVAFYRDTQQRIARQHHRTSVDVYASQARHESPFWRMRSRTAEEAGPVVQAASAAAGGRVRLSDDALVTEMPVIDGDLIRRHATLTHPSLEQPLAWLGGVDLAPLLGMLACDRLVTDVVSDWSRRMAPERAREVLAWLLERGIVVRAT